MSLVLVQRLVQKDKFRCFIGASLVVPFCLN